MYAPLLIYVSVDGRKTPGRYPPGRSAIANFRGTIKSRFNTHLIIITQGQHDFIITLSPKIYTQTKSTRLLNQTKTTRKTRPKVAPSLKTVPDRGEAGREHPSLSSPTKRNRCPLRSPSPARTEPEQVSSGLIQLQCCTRCY